MIENIDVMTPKATILKRYRIIELLLMLALVLLGASSIYGWFVSDTHVDAIAKTSNPTAIFIGAGYQEDIMYLDLSDIDVKVANSYQENNVTYYYKDFVFCIKGMNVDTYKLQLAYTTNNQFVYEIYPAYESTNSNESNVKGKVTYTTHTSPSSNKYYYVANSTAKLPLVEGYLNANGTIGKTNDRYYEQTYGTYTNVQENAVPIYWQSDLLEGSTLDTSEFCNYYFLRVSWTGEKANNKETDIIYITAKNMGS
ncbi:MAG: hypothetical protein J6W64_07450 [Bacilli bacterium]|nr:hypothetical protein [Bacilli bacterium]